MQSAIRDTDPLRPFDKRKSFVANRHLAIIVFVALLLLLGRPTAVFGGIGPVVIDSIDGMFWGGAFAHIREEIFEVQPSGADRDASTSVTGVVFSRGAKASRLHRVPCHIFGRTPLAVFQAGFSFTGQFRIETAAALGESLPQAEGPNTFRFSTIANANPLYRFPVAIPFVYSQTTKMFPCKVK